ncbi:MAG: type II toxin-antitoxin system mRNA interferase toxin, RelE/StbE family [Bacteriovoracales bacterium]|nr:type II toxin-antitoxin system mRNA interferase toxin, RelE/StbE family [Bacteriovoracales bacterium]
MDIRNVVLSRAALKDLRRVPATILDKFQSWVEAIEIQGLHKVRKLPGLHDEPLKGKRKGQRSIRLSRSYRAIYTIEKEKVMIVFVREVSKHGY